MNTNGEKRIESSAGKPGFSELDFGAWIEHKKVSGTESFIFTQAVPDTFCVPRGVTFFPQRT
jgi:hypothetical protein